MPHPDPRPQFIQSVALQVVRDARCPVSTTDVRRLVNDRHGDRLHRPIVTEQIYRAMLELHRRKAVRRVRHDRDKKTCYWQCITTMGQQQPPETGLT